MTVCPLSNIKLRVFPRLEDHNLKRLLALGLCVTVNSDDPAYFGGYIGENFRALQQALDLSRSELAALARNSIEASFLDESAKRHWYGVLEAYLARNTAPGHPDPPQPPKSH